MLRNIALIAAVAITASPAGAQSVYYGGTSYPSPAISYAGSYGGPYGGNPGPYGGTAPVPYAYGYGGGLITSNVSYGYGSYHGSE